MINFNRFIFYPIKKKVNLTDLSDLLNDYIIDKFISDNFIISDISSITNPIDNTVIFLEKKNYIRMIIHRNKLFYKKFL